MNLNFIEMKRLVKITAFLLMILSAGSFTLNAQHDMGGMNMDTTRMKMMHRGMMHDHGMNMKPDSMMMKGMGREMGPVMMPGMRDMDRGRMMQGMKGGMCQCPMMQGMMRPPFGMRHFGPGFDHFGPGRDYMMPDRWIFENIPNLTDKQKKDISDIRDKQMADMKKLREEMQAKMKTMREARKADVEKLLTPDQKKWLNDNTPEPQEKVNQQK